MEKKRLRATKGHLKVHGAHTNCRKDLFLRNVKSKTIEKTSWKCELKNRRGSFPWKNRRKDIFLGNMHSSTA